MSCKKCSGNRIAFISGKTSDCFNLSLNGKEYDGIYVPSEAGIGGGDYIEFNYCLDCGQIQGEFPVHPENELEECE